MQTFLPYSDFVKSAQSLDPLRLGKQRVETLQIMKALCGGKGWINHPATRMWTGYEAALNRYQEAVCDEWMARGFKDTCLDKTAAIFHQAFGWEVEMELPPWLGYKPFHDAHQSNLVRKYEEYYRPQFPDIPADLEYIWPVSPSLERTN